MSGNPYDALIGAATPPKDDNPYGELVEQRASVSLRSASLQAESRNPDLYARADAIARRAGLPVDVVANNQDQFEQRERLERMDRLGRESPTVAAFLSDPRRMALAQDDVDNLDRLGTVLGMSAATGNAERGWGEFGGDLGLQFRQLARLGMLATLETPVNAVNLVNRQFNKAASGLAALFGQTPESQVAMYQQPDALREFRADTEALNASEFEQQASFKLSAQQRERPTTFLAGLRYMAENPSVIATDLAGVGGAMSSAIVPGSRAATVGLQSTQQASMASADVVAALTTKGYSEQDAQTAAADAFGWATAAGVLIPQLTPGGTAFEGLVARETAQMAGAPATRAATTLVGEPLSESLEEAVVQAVTNIGSADPAGQGVGGAAAQGLAVGTGMAAPAAVSQYRQAQLQAEVARVFSSAGGSARLNAITDAAAAAKLGERSPDDLAEFTRQAGSGHVYLRTEQAQVLFQDGFDVAALVGGEEALAEQANAGELVIPMDQWVSVISRLPNAEEFKRHGRMRADDLSAAELEAFDPDAELAALGYTPDTDEAAERAAPVAADPRQQITDDVFGQLVATDRYTPAAAEAQAKLWGAAFSRFGQINGEDPLALYQRYMGGIGDGSPSVLSTPRWNGTAELDALLDSIRLGDAATPTAVNGPSLASWLVASGGIRESGGELRARDAGKLRPGLVNNAGLPMDRARELAVEAGYLPEGADLNDFIDALDADLRGNQVFSEQHQDRARADFELERDRLLQAIEDTPALRDMPREDFNALTNQQISDALFGGQAFDQSPTDQTDSAAFQRWSQGAPLVDDLADYVGGPAVFRMLHGTTASFDAFDRERANIESDFGAGFYFTNNPADVSENYAGLGPDLTNKIQREAERIAGERDLDYGDPEVVAEARARWVQNEGSTMPVFVRALNPAIVGGENETVFTFEEPYNEELDEFGEPEGTLLPVLEALREIQADGEFGDFDAEKVIADIFGEHWDGDSIGLNDMIGQMKGSEGLMYAADERNGDMASSEIIRQVLERAGFDAVVDFTVDMKFGSQRETGQKMAGMSDDTVHVIAFQPAQVKSSIGNSGAFDPENPSVLYQSSVPADAEIEQLRARVAELEAELRTDNLTGLRNQRAFDEDEALGWSTVAAADMDGLKRLNDAIGHEAADQVLRGIGGIMLATEGDGVRFYRRSGDEFAARFEDAENADRVMADLQARLEQVAIDFDVSGPDGATRNFTYEGIGISYGTGPDYEAADVAAIGNKQDRLASGAREEARADGAPRRLRPRDDTAWGEGRRREDQGPARPGVTDTLFQSTPPTGGVSASGDPTQTDAFRRWFGESKVVDESGAPLVVYHGTGGNFDVFDNAKAPAGHDKNRRGVAWFSDAPEVASGFAGYQDGTRVGGVQLGNSNVMPVYLSIQNPYVDKRGQYARSGGLTREVVAELEEEGYDGVIWPESNFDLPDTTMDGPVTGYFRNRNGEVFGDDVPFPSQYAVFNPSQIKSATGNSGAFDPADPSILNQPDGGGGPSPRGQIKIAPDRSMRIDLFATADRTTFLHESGHFFLEVFRDIATAPDAPQQARDDYAALLAWFGTETIGTEQHEQFARGFEQYLGEGKAPSAELQSVFSQFKAWVLSIYKALRHLNVTLTDDVRAVFDRMLATEEEIEAAQVRQGMAPMVRDLKEAAALGLTEKQFADYQSMTEAATEEAREEVLAKLLAAEKRAREVWWKEEQAAVRSEVLAEYEATPAVRALRILSGRQVVNGEPVPEALVGLKLDKAAIVAGYGTDYLKRLGRTYARSGGVDHDVAAMRLGFTSGDALLNALANVPDTLARVDAEVASRMRERHGDPMTDGTLAEVALAAVHGNKRVKLLEYEMGLLADLAKQPRRDPREIKAAAVALVARKTSRQLRPSDYLASERRAAREATHAAAKGDFAAALLAKRQQAFNAALYRAALDAQKRAESTANYLRKAGSDKTRARVGKQAGKPYVEALDAIFAGIEVRGVSGKQVSRRAALREWVRQRQEAGDHTAVPDTLLARVEAERVTNLADLTITEAEALREAVENLLHLARTKNRLRTAKGERDWEDAKADLVERLERQTSRHGRRGISATDRAVLERVGDAYAAGANWVLQPETLVEWLDDGTDGPFHDLLWEPSEAAEHKREQLNRMVGERLQAALDALPAAERKALDRRYRIESLDADVSGHSILSALLNMGNAGNRDKLLRGGRVVGDEIVPFTEAQLAEMFAKLSKPQAEMVQGVWDAVDLLWPEIVALEEQLNGIAPGRVQSTPFTAITRDGPVALRGGYYPAMYDPAGARAGQFAEDEQAKKVLAGQTPIRATTSKGHTEKRTDFAAPLLLDYHSVLTRHLDGVIGDIAYRQFLQQVFKVLGDPDVRRMIDNRIGQGAAKGLQKSFERGATGNFALAGPLFGPFQKVVDATMSNFSSAALGFRIPLALANVVTAPILASARVKKRFLVRGFTSYYGGGPNVIANMRTHAAAVRALSPMMQKRSEARTIELSSIIANLRGKRGIRAQMIELAFAVHQWIVPLAENAIWMGAYQQAQSEGGDLTEAVRMADKAIRQTQTKHTAKDLSQAEGGYMRPLMMFSGPLVIINNRLQESGLRGLRGDVRNWKQALGVWIAMAAGGAWVFELMMGRGAEDEDDDGDVGVSDWMWWAGKKLGLQPFAAFPLLRDAAGFADQEFARPMPLVSGMIDVVKFGKEAGEQLFSDEEPDPDALTKKFVRAAGTVTGVPSNQLLRSGEYLVAVGSGEHTPQNPAAEAYYLMQGPPDEE